jgi:hypothetical protein
VSEQCAIAYDGCDADPGCTAYLQCLLDCPVAADGYVDGACAGACPIADSSATRKAVNNVVFCLERGDGADACVECDNQQAADPDLHQTCSASAETDPCWKCEDENCCDTYQRCEDNAECDALVTCVQACPEADDACFTACYTAHPDGLADWGARIGCITVLCLDECVDGTPDPCSQCIAAHCADEHMACNKQPDCFMFSDCVATCTGTPVECVEGCLDTYPAAEENGIALGSCGNVECPVECGG